MLATRVRPAIDAGIDEHSPAPKAPAFAAVAVEHLQLTFAESPVLCFKLTIVNQSGDALACDAEKFQLKVGEEILPAVPRTLAGAPRPSRPDGGIWRGADPAARVV